MYTYVTTSNKELSQRKAEAYHELSKVLTELRGNPLKLVETFFGIKLIDYQAWAYINMYYRRFSCLLGCRAVGKNTLTSILNMTKMMLIPGYRIYLLANSFSQAAEGFLKLEDIALRRIPSFKTTTDIFAEEVARNVQGTSGFVHDKSGYNVRLYNESALICLPTSETTIRGKRANCVVFDESGFNNDTSWFSAVENFVNVDENFSTGVDSNTALEPKNFPQSIIYQSSASSVDSWLWQKYRQYAIKMIEGDTNYFCCDLNCWTVLEHSSIDGEPIKSHLSRDQIEEARESDLDKFERELENKFRRGGGVNAILPMDVLIRNSTPRKPLLFNDTGKKRFLFAYDPARNFDNSVLGIFQIINDKEVGLKLRVENMISFVDRKSRKKTPMTMPRQLEIIREQLAKYNGERNPDYSQIEMFLIDSGAGGGGISAVADSLLSKWHDKDGRERRGLIDPVHKQYETSRQVYTNCSEIIRLVDPSSHKKLMFDAMERMIKLNLVEFTQYDSKEYLMLEDEHGEFKMVQLQAEEIEPLVQIELAKNECSQIVRNDTANGSVTYDLERSVRNTMHDDRAYVISMACWGLSLLRRDDLLTPMNTESTIFDFAKFKAPTFNRRR